MIPPLHLEDRASAAIFPACRLQKIQGLPAANSCKPEASTVAMTTAEWLRTVIAPLSAEPSPDLHRFFQLSGDRHVAYYVRFSADVILGAIFQARNWRGARDNLWAEERRVEALKLYYKALGTICEAESQRLRSHHLAFLSNERFHRCMLACSSELVLTSHETVTMSFPAVLEPAGITAFDFSKVIEHFIRHEESLPRELKRHLNSIEERILESMAWEKGSSMYDSLIISEPKLTSEINRLNLSPQRPNPQGGGETCATTTINGFFQKVMKLAAVRIRNLCDRLQQSQQVQEHVFRAFQHALHRETILFFNRHIDQVILCSLFGICKARNVTFRDIIYRYTGKQPQCKQSVFRNVLLDVTKPEKAGQETGDIIKFHNEVFVPSTKSFLLQMGSDAGPSVRNNSAASKVKDQTCEAQAPASPRLSAFASLPVMSPKKVSAKHNVYVSRLPCKKVDTIMSPHTRTLYACVGESTRAFQSPSKDLTDINNRLNRRRLGRLDFEAAAVMRDSSQVANTLNNILKGNAGNSYSIRPVGDPSIPKLWPPSKRSRSD